TKIFFRRTRVVNAFFLGGLITLFVSLPVFAAIAWIRYPSAPVQAQAAEPEQKKATLEDEFAGLRIASYGLMSGQARYVFVDPDGKRIRSEDLLSRAITIDPRGPREVRLLRGTDSLTVYR
ncbi:hypothetical protein ABRP29_05365, partial [Pseudomonas sp. WHRI 8822A]